MEKSTVKGVLEQNKIIKAEGKIRHEAFSEELNLVGFLPYNENISLTGYLNLNNKLSLTPYLAKYDDDLLVIKIMKYAKIEKNETFYLTTNNILPIKDAVEFFLKKYKSHKERYKLQEYLKNPNKTNADALINMLTNQVGVDFLLIDENGQIYYNPEKNPLFFYRDVDNSDCVADSFLCLCSYINPKSGILSYIGLPPEECICTLKNVDGYFPEHPIRQINNNEEDYLPF